MSEMIEIKNLRVDYDGITAVHDLNLVIPQGQIYGFVGPNGAGKTSTIRVLGGVLEPTCGTVRLNGFDLETAREKALSGVGYMPDFAPVYEHLKVWEYLDVFAAAYGIEYDQRARRVDEWVVKAGLQEKRDDFVRGLSRGMRQRLVLAKTLLPRPAILLLDEPASGLDPVARKQMRDLLSEAAAGGATIFVSSHILSELSEFCDAVGILEKGRLVISGTLNDIRQAMGTSKRVKIMFLDDDQSPERFWSLVAEWGINKDTVVRDQGAYILDFYPEDHVASEFLAKLVARGALVTHFSIEKDNIEDIFFKIGAKEVS